MCPADHRFEERHAYPPPSEVACSCGRTAARMPHRVSTWNCDGDGVTERATMTEAKDIWEDTALSGTDGVNDFYYKSDKVQVDLSRDRPLKPTLSPKQKLRARLSDHPDA